MNYFEALDIIDSRIESARSKSPGVATTILYGREDFHTFCPLCLVNTRFRGGNCTNCIAENRCLETPCATAHISRTDLSAGIITVAKCLKVWKEQIRICRDLLLEFKDWDGDYEKEFYDVMLPSGELVQWCWPNTGKMVDIHLDPGADIQREWTPESGIKVKLSPDHPLDKEEE